MNWPSARLASLPSLYRSVHPSPDQNVDYLIATLNRNVTVNQFTKGLKYTKELHLKPSIFTANMGCC